MRDRKRAYLVLMGTCLGLFVLAWGVVRFVSVPLAVAMSLVAAVIPPAAVIVGNSGVLRGTEPLDFERPEDTDEDPDRDMDGDGEGGGR